MVNILIVEDKPRQLHGLLKIIQALEKEWYTEHATNISEAWLKLTKKKYDAIIIDVMLPAPPPIPRQAEGLYLCAWLQESIDGLPPTPPGDIIKENKNAKIIFLTSLGQAHCAKPIEDLKLTNYILIDRIEGLADDQYDKIKNHIKENN